MDKYEYNLKLDQMKTLMAEERYQEAAEIADTFNWRKIKNVTALVRASEIYEQVERFEESREILLMAYDRSPIGRTIIYRLACIAIKMQNYDEAKEFYREFVEIAPHDNLKYVLKYEINKAQGSDYNTLIANLEELKEQEFTEEWGYELAYMYHMAGMGEQCIETCDEIVLYFGQGPYVEQALELKMLYQPLSKQQEEKYRQIRQQQQGVTEVRPEDVLESGEIVTSTVQIPQVKLSPERFNTQNLQEELQRSMQQIMNATEPETVEDSMDAIKKLVEEIPYLQIPVEKDTEDRVGVAPHIATAQEIDDSLKLNFQELLNEEYDGQLQISVPGGDLYEPQVTGQMTIEEVLAEWEKTRRAAATALQEAQQQKLESAKAKALRDAGDIMERLADVIPKLESGVSPQELLREQYLAEPQTGEERAAQMVANMNQLLQMEIERLSTENAQIDEQLAVAQEFITAQDLLTEEAQTPEVVLPDTVEELLADKEIAEALESEGLLEEILEPEKAGIKQEKLVTEETDVEEISIEEASIKEAVQEEPNLEEIPVVELISPEDFDEVTTVAEVALESETVESAEEEDAIKESIEKASLVQDEVVEDYATIENVAEEKTIESTDEKEKEDELPEVEIPEIELPQDIMQEEEAVRRILTSCVPATALNEEQRELFSYFMSIKGMEEQICDALNHISMRILSGESAKTGNLLVQGGSGSGKTVFATNFVKALQQITGRTDAKVGKIQAEVLNKKDPGTVLSKVAGGCLIIEEAGELSKDIAEKLAALLEKDTQGTLLILEDTRRGIEEVLVKDTGFASRFSERISIPIFTNDELVVFAKAYAAEHGYSIDEMGVLALYNCISNIQKIDRETTIAEVKEIVDGAIEHVERGTLKKVFSILTSTRFDEDDYIILHEKDFNS